MAELTVKWRDTGSEKPFIASHLCVFLSCKQELFPRWILLGEPMEQREQSRVCSDFAESRKRKSIEICSKKNYARRKNFFPFSSAPYGEGKNLFGERIIPGEFGDVGRRLFGVFPAEDSVETGLLQLNARDGGRLFA